MPHEDGSICVCGTPDSILHAEVLGRWPDNFLRYTIVFPFNVPGLDKQGVIALFREAFASWEAVCGLQTEYVEDASRAHAVIRQGRIDGPSQVLAWSELADGTNRQKKQMYDAAEAFVADDSPPPGKINLKAVIRHEVGHLIGLPHLANGNLLQPMYSPSIFMPQAGDIREAQARYGPPKAKPQPPTPATGLVSIPAEVAAKALRDAGWTVSPPSPQ